VSFDRRKFEEFLGVLKVDTKELGRVILGENLRGTQKRFLREMYAGLDEGVNEFITLKSRQIGISTISLAIDMFYAFNVPGASGAIVTHEEGARDQFRTILQTYYDNLPEAYTQDQKAHNRNQWVLGNDTVFQYKVAGTKAISAKTLGRSSALVFCHATEVAFWGDPKQINSLHDTFAEFNPSRWYHWESTANGYNHFESFWRDAEKSVTVKPIFVSWWADEFARCPRGSLRYKEFWGHKGRPTQYERDIARQIVDLYDVEVDDEQLAWFRWCLAEKCKGDEDHRRSDFPCTPEEAFVATGSNYFSSDSLTKAYRRVIKEKPPKCYRFHIGERFTDIKMQECTDRHAMLRIWEEPQPGAYYAIGGDPAHASSDEADRDVLSVHRCWSNRVEQVAEFCVTEMNTTQYAWICAYLCGAYQPCIWNIELNGPGGAVLQELDALKRQVGSGFFGSMDRDITNAVRKIQDFLYAREDSVKGRPIGKHTMTTSRIKDGYLSLLRGAFEIGTYVPHSRYLLDEMKSFVRDGGWLGASGRSKDDRVIGAALSYLAYNNTLRNMLVMRRIDWFEDEELKEQEEANAQKPSVITKTVADFMDKIGFNRQPHNPSGAKAYVPAKYQKGATSIRAGRGSTKRSPLYRQ
jgi:hypothetical protein